MKLYQSIVVSYETEGEEYSYTFSNLTPYSLTSEDSFSTAERIEIEDTKGYKVDEVFMLYVDENNPSEPLDIFGEKRLVITDDMTQTMCALAFARKKHQGQMRKSGEPYIVHTLTMACDAFSLGIKDDNTVATILLPDVCEDCGVSVAELPVNDTVKRGVELMTFIVMDGETKDIAKRRYYNMLIDSKEASITKLIL